MGGRAILGSEEEEVMPEEEAWVTGFLRSRWLSWYRLKGTSKVENGIFNFFFSLKRDCGMASPRSVACSWCSVAPSRS